MQDRSSYEVLHTAIGDSHIMIKNVLVVFFFFIYNMLFLLLVKVALADLPVHCLKHQIVGKWTLMLTSPLIKGSGELACGHDIPDNERTSWHAGFKDFKPTKKIPVTLT